MNQKRNILKILFAFLKAAIFVLTLFYIWKKINNNDDFSRFFSEFSQLKSTQLWLIILVFIAMFLNWGLETIKWKLLISKFEHIKFLRAYRAVWSGVTINNWVPNRLAEFLGRILYISQENRTKAIFSTLVGNASQLIMTVLWGSLGFLFWYNFNCPCMYYPRIILIILLNGILIYFYLNIAGIHKIILRIKFLSFISKYSEVISTYKRKELVTVMLFSFLRYFVYLFQYYLLLIAFRIDVDPLTLMSSVAAIFLVQAVLPAVTLTEIGIRGATVLFFIGKYSSDINGMLAAAYGLWLINIIIPTLFGAFFIIGIKSKEEKNKIYATKTQNQ